MATSPKIHISNKDREQSKDELPNELTEKLKNGVNTHVISELSERLYALKKASGFDSLNQIAAIREQFEALNKATVLDTLSRIAAIKEQFDALHKTSALSIALDDLNKATGLDTRKKIAAIIEQPNTMKEVASKTLLSFNLFPIKSFESSLKKINYPNSIEHALARDWQNVGNDLWKSYLKVSDNQLSDNDEQSSLSCDDRKLIVLTGKSKICSELQKKRLSI